MSAPAGQVFKRILVPVDFAASSDDDSEHAVEVGNQLIDFSPASLDAVRTAAMVARVSGGELRFVHATPNLDYSAMYTGPTGASLPAKVVEEIHTKARSTSLEVLEQLASTYCEGVKVTLAARAGVASNVVLEEARQYDADLIVLAASGRTRVARFFVGSTADKLIRRADCPVLVIPAHTE